MTLERSPLEPSRPAPPPRFSNLQLRIITAVIALPILIAAIFAGGWYFAVAAGLPGVSRVVDGAITHLARVRQLANPVEGHMEKAIDEHERIFFALKSGNAAAASAALTRHLDRVFETVQRLMRVHAEYFDDGARAVQTARSAEKPSLPRAPAPAR